MRCVCVEATISGRLEGCGGIRVLSVLNDGHEGQHFSSIIDKCRVSESNGVAS